MSDAAQTVISIAGMHRSGTSMVARLLNLCGVDLGAEQDMMPASVANPEGYWEHIWFNYFNNQLLEFYLGAWDTVPVYPPNWENAPGVEWIKREARAVIGRFNSPVWGWKDPRNSITLPFWKQLVPQLKTVVCLRNPLDVAASLNKRGSSSFLFGLRVWWEYNSQILLESTQSDRVVTLFDVYFQNGRQELERVTRALGIHASESGIEEACKTSQESLRHSFTTIEKFAAGCPWQGAMETYCKLLTEAGPYCRELVGDEWPRVEGFASSWTPKSCALPTATPGDELYKTISSLEEELRQRQNELAQLAESTDQKIGDLDAIKSRLTSAVAQISAQRDQSYAAYD